MSKSCQNNKETKSVKHQKGFFNKTRYARITSNRENLKVPKQKNDYPNESK